jgi:monolysocardiolipin acyltransferase
MSSTTIFGVAALCRSFLFLCSRPEVHGLDSFLELLDSRRDPATRTRGLLTGTCDYMLCILLRKG